MTTRDAAATAPPGDFGHMCTTVEFRTRAGGFPVVRQLSRGTPSQGPLFVAALLCAGFVVAAVLLEVIGGQNANSPHPSWAERVVPLAWPQPIRVLWWLLIAAAAGAYRTLLNRAGLTQRRAVTLVIVLPFVLFAAGIATGAEWATWH